MKRSLFLLDRRKLRTFTGYTGSTAWAWAAGGHFSSSAIFSVAEKKVKSHYHFQGVFLSNPTSSSRAANSDILSIKFPLMTFYTYLPPFDPLAQDNDKDHQEDHNQAANSNYNPHPPAEPQQRTRSTGTTWLSHDRRPRQKRRIMNKWLILWRMCSQSEVL